jgi:hypothetical protein
MRAIFIGSMKHLTRWICLLAIPLAALPTQARAEEAPALTLLNPVVGTIAAGAEQGYTFQAAPNLVYALRVTALNGDLQPRLIITGAAETALASFPSGLRAAAVEGISLVEGGQITIRVAGEGAGDFRLLALPGYSHLLLQDRLDAGTMFGGWKTAQRMAAPSSGVLRLQMNGSQNRAWIRAERLEALPANSYVEATVDASTSTNTWEVGLLLRAQPEGTDLNGYLFTVRRDGLWRFARGTQNEITAISDWQALPEGQDLRQPLQLAAYMSGDTFTLFANNQRLATIQDGAYPTGLIGALIDSDGGFVSADFDNFVLTSQGTPVAGVPAEVPALGQGRQAVLAALIAGGALPGLGRLAFSQPEAFVTNSTDRGITVVPLARGNRYADVVFAGEIEWNTSSEDAACAMEIRHSGSDTFTFIYIDRKGGFGVRQQDGAETPINNYGLTPAVRRENLARNEMVIVAIGGGLIVYINGQKVADIAVPSGEGNVFLAAYNYAYTSTLCRFRDVWLISF